MWPSVLGADLPAFGVVAVVRGSNYGGPKSVFSGLARCSAMEFLQGQEEMQIQVSSLLL